DGQFGWRALFDGRERGLPDLVIAPDKNCGHCCDRGEEHYREAADVEASSSPWGRLAVRLGLKGGHGGRERGIVPKDRPFELAQLGTRLQPELAGRHPPGFTVDLERFRLSSAVEGEDELPAQPFAEWVRGD